MFAVEHANSSAQYSEHSNSSAQYSEHANCSAPHSEHANSSAHHSEPSSFSHALTPAIYQQTQHHSNKHPLVAPQRQAHQMLHPYSYRPHNIHAGDDTVLRSVPDESDDVTNPVLRSVQDKSDDVTSQMLRPVRDESDDVTSQMLRSATDEITSVGVVSTDSHSLIRRITRSLQRRHERTPSIHREIKAARQLGVIMTAFTLCFLPYFICFLIVAFCHDCVPHNISVIVTWLGYINSTLNPIIYPLCNATFRLKFRKMMRLGSMEQRRIQYLGSLHRGPVISSSRHTTRQSRL